MEKAQIAQTAKDAEELFKTIMNLYWTYLEGLEKYIQNIPETESELLNGLNQHMQEVQSALEHDIAVFDEAIHSDVEDLHKLQDKLKVDTIYQKLNKK